MKSNLTYEKIKINKIIFNKSLEKQIEFEYQLPDYYTGIFKVLQFNLSPHISSCRASNKQFIIDGNAKMQLLYIDEEAGNIKAIHQNIPFSKTIDVEEAKPDSIIFYDVNVNYKNCKIISPKKLDVKATLTISIKIQSQEEENILSETTDKNLQLKHVPITITSTQIYSPQQFTINEQLKLQNLIKDVLDIKITIVDEEYKIISNKIISKADAEIEILYCADENNNPLTEKITVPINNIIDMPGIDENFQFNVKYDVTAINFEILQEGKILNISADVLINSYGNLCKEIEIITDAFSTKYELNFTKKEFDSSTIISSINEAITIEKIISDVNLYKIYYVDVDIKDLNNANNTENLKFKAKLNIKALGLNKESTIETYSKTIPIEFKINRNNIKSNYINPNINDVKILKIDSYLKDNGEFEIKVKFNIKGFIFANDKIMTLSDIVVDENKVKEKSKAALTLYYPNAGDNVWDIAKHFCTSPSEIIETNGLNSDIIEDETMLIIPII